MGASDHPSTRSRTGSPQEIEHLAHRLDALLSTLAAGVMEADLDGRYTYANPAALRILQTSGPELVGRTLSEIGFERYDESGDLIPPERAPLQRAGRDGHEVVQAVIRYVRPPAFNVWIESQTAPLRSSSGALLGTVVSFIDVTDRFRLQAAERTGLDRLSALLRSMAAGVMLVDADGRIQYANEAAAALSGLKPEDVVGQLVADPAWQLTDETGVVLPYEALPVPTALRERREVRGVELGVPTLTGVMRWMRVSAVPVFERDGTLRGAVVTTEDVTERHTLAEQLLQAQKIEGMGQLAGGVAHDFNNLLTVIIGNAELALSAVPAGSPAETDVREIRDAANRGAALTRQMLTFARKQVVQPRPVYCDRLIDAVENLLHRALGEKVVLRRAFAADLWPVQVDPGQMEQLLMNLAINARDAMPRGGSLTIEAHNTSIAAQEAKFHPGIEAGDFVKLSIGDTGTGMSRELIVQIFDPFFTTKPVGSGTGLGLSICYGIVKQARGFISVESELGRGTTFHIHLPRTHRITSDSPVMPHSALAEGVGTILLVEDQDAVRSLVARALTGYGYNVLSASTGKRALAMQQDMTGPLDLLLTDVVMPEMSGLELASLLQARLPGLPVLYMTGFVDLRNAELSTPDIEENLLLKPFTPMQLLQRVQRLLSAMSK